MNELEAQSRNREMELAFKQALEDSYWSFHDLATLLGMDDQDAHDFAMQNQGHALTPQNAMNALQDFI